jgi:hypothetical protein
MRWAHLAAVVIALSRAIFPVTAAFQMARAAKRLHTLKKRVHLELIDGMGRPC